MVEKNNLKSKMKFQFILLWMTTRLLNVSSMIMTHPDYPNILTNDINALNYTSTSTQKICIKQHPNSSRGPQNTTKIEATTFKDLVQHSDIYVDKSLFIRSIIMSNDSIISFTYPRRWGKSINLDMVKTFLEIEVDPKGNPVSIESTWSYEYFKHGQIMLPDGKSEMLERPPYISRHKNHIEKFLGKYPVIYLDLSASQPTSYNLDGFYEAFRKAIGATFEKHNYLAKVLTDKARKATFEGYKKGKTCGIKEMTESLRFLSELLFKHFKQRVFIFIDGYDYMIEQAFFAVPSKIGEEDAKKFLNFYSKFLHTTLKENKDHLRTGVLSGVFNVDDCFKESGLHNIVNYNMLNKNLEPFHGFTLQEVEQLYHELDIPAKLIKDVFNWHSGYHLGDYPKTTVFNSWFVINFANTRKLEKYFAKTSSLQIFQRTLRFEKNRAFFQAVLSGSADAEIPRKNLNLDVVDITFVKAVAEDRNPDIDNIKTSSSIFILFYAAGYLSLDVESVHFPSTELIPIRIPCREIEGVIVHELKCYYTGRFGEKSSRAAENAARGLIHTLHLKVGINPTLSFPLNELYKQLPNEIDEANFLILLYVKSNFHFNIGYRLQYYDNENKPRRIYMTVYNHDIAVVYEYKPSASIMDMLSGADIRALIMDRFRNKNVKMSGDSDTGEFTDHEFFFRNKNVRMIRFGSIQGGSGSSMASVFFGIIPFVWSETEKKFVPVKRWSYNFAAFRDYNNGRSVESSCNDRSLY